MRREVLRRVPPALDPQVIVEFLLACVIFFEGELVLDELGFDLSDVPRAAPERDAPGS